jgi:hypothetical protein
LTFAAGQMTEWTMDGILLLKTSNFLCSVVEGILRNLLSAAQLAFNQPFARARRGSRVDACNKMR